MLSEKGQTEKVKNCRISLMWDIKQKATNDKQGKQTKAHRHRQQYGGYQRERELGVLKGRGGQVYGDGRRFDFGW